MWLLLALIQVVEAPVIEGEPDELMRMFWQDPAPLVLQLGIAAVAVTIGHLPLLLQKMGSAVVESW
jgi:hypothetical protein